MSNPMLKMVYFITTIAACTTGLLFRSYSFQTNFTKAQNVRQQLGLETLLEKADYDAGTGTYSIPRGMDLKYLDFDNDGSLEPYITYQGKIFPLLEDSSGNLTRQIAEGEYDGK